MKLLAASQTFETLAALEKNRQADTNRRKVTRSVYSDTSPPSSFFHRRILTNCNAQIGESSSRSSCQALVFCKSPVEASTGRAGKAAGLLLVATLARGAGGGPAQE